MADDENTLRVLGRCHDHMHVERREGGKVKLGIVKNHEEGKPIPAGVEYIDGVRQHEDDPSLYDVTSSVRVPGPARVNSPKYREGYDRIFGKKPAEKFLN